MEPDQFREIFNFLPGNYIILAPDAPRFTILAYNRSRADETFTDKNDIGKGIFESFPDNPADTDANGVAMLSASLHTVLKEKKPHEMARQKYDIPRPDNNGFETRYWLPKNIPVINETGDVTQIIHYVKDVTAEVFAEKREKQNRQNFEDFFNQSNSPFAIIMGSEFTFSYANPAYIELMNNRELVGKTVLEAIPELKDQPFMQQLQTVFETGEAYHGIEVPATAQFKGAAIPVTRFFNLSYTAIKEEGSSIKGILAYAYDVTEQVALRKRDQLNRINQQAFDLFMQAPVGICILKGGDYVIELANYPMLEIWGKTSAIIGKNLMDSLPEIEGQGFIAILDRVRQTGEAFHANEHETSLVRKGKQETVYINFLYQPYYEVDQTISGIIAIATEVTEQVISRKKIEYAEENARLAMESASLGNYDISLETDEMFTSPRFNIIWGLENTIQRAEFAGAIHPDDQDLRLQAHAESLKTGKLFYEARVVWKDGSVHWVRINGSVLFNENKKPSRLIGVIQDITKQRGFADEMKRLVKEKTLDLQNLNEELERSNRELEQFAYVTSHDLQEPLRKIQIYSSMIAKNDLLHNSLSVYVEKVESSAKRMSGLIKELLDYARLSKTNEVFTQVDLNSVLQSVLSDFEILIGQKNAVIDHDPLESIMAVPLQINQLFFNLIGNSLKFAKDDQPVHIAIRAKQLSSEELTSYPSLDPGKKYYQVTVTDNGIGFEQAYAEKIFSIFQRLNEKPGHEGYGIGLALCNRVVQNHHGLISSRGIPGEGAVFTVILPFVQG